MGIIKTREQNDFILAFLNEEIKKTDNTQLEEYNDALRTVRIEFIRRY